MERKEWMDSLGGSAGWARRDVIKAIATLAATPLITQVVGAAPVPLPASITAGKRNQPFDSGWRFLRGDAPGAELPGFDDASWRTLDLPHDFSVEALPPRASDANGEGTEWGMSVTPTRVGPFDTELSEGEQATGWFVGGTGWYRKRFPAAAIPTDGQMEVVFDGVYMNSDVWLNGKLLGNHPYGYTAFAYDLTPHLRRDGENVLAVRVRNDGRNSRWYSGSGIYRHVWLNTTGSVCVPLWGLFVTTPEVSQESASVKVALQIENRGQGAQDVTVRIRLLNPNNAIAGTREVLQTVAAGASANMEQVVPVAAPQLWSPATPHLYRAEVTLLVGGHAADTASTSFGIRTVEIDAEHGLRINGESVKLKGGCMHHDNGLLGSCAIDRAEERRIELMKAHGFNAIRTSHNPPSSAFLDACDRLGVMVLDEAFDCWEREKNPQDYHLYFDDWWKRDLSSMVLRDRNHPSVVLWSIGNEIPERAEPSGVELSRMLIAQIKALDSTRLVTAAVNGRAGPLIEPAFTHLEVAGYNYLFDAWEPEHALHPQRVMVGTESIPRHSYLTWREVEKNSYVIGDFVWTAIDYMGESAIGNAQLDTPTFRFGGPPSGGPGKAGGPGANAAAPTPEGAPQPPKSTGADSAQAQPAPWATFAGDAMGAAMMTGLGQRLSFPWFNAYCGDIDLVGHTKPQWYYRSVFWGLSKLEMTVRRPVPEGRTEVLSTWGWSDELRSWTWPGDEGKTVRVRVFSTGDQVRLLLNGKEIGVKPVSPETELTAEFEVPYAPGELKAVAMAGGQQIAELSFKTAGKPAKLRLTADRAAIRNDRNDLSYVTVEVCDEAGQLVPDAVVPVSLSVSGAAELAAAGSANPKDVESFRGARPRTYHGRCVAIVRPKGAVGTATVRAQADGLAPASIVVRMS